MGSNKPKARKRNNTVLNYSIFFVLAVLLIFLSVRAVPLDSQIQQEESVDVATYVDDFFRDSLPGRIEQSSEACALFSRLSSGSDEDWEIQGYQATIGSRYCFLTHGIGTVEQIGENAVVLRLNGVEGACTVRIATEYVFGNEVRDATGMIRLEDFDHLTTFNRVSEIINERIRTQVLPPFLDEVQVRDTVYVAGACCINKRLMDMTPIELMPIDLKVNH